MNSIKIAQLLFLNLKKKFVFEVNFWKDSIIIQKGNYEYEQLYILVSEIIISKSYNNHYE